MLNNGPALGLLYVGSMNCFKGNREVHFCCMTGRYWSSVPCHHSFQLNEMQKRLTAVPRGKIECIRGPLLDADRTLPAQNLALV